MSRELPPELVKFSSCSAMPEEEEEEPEQEPKGGVRIVSSVTQEEMQRSIALLEASLAELKGKGNAFGKGAGSGAGSGKGSSSKSSFQPKGAIDSGKGSCDSSKGSYDTSKGSYDTSKGSYDSSKGSYDTSKGSYDSSKGSLQAFNEWLLYSGDSPPTSHRQQIQQVLEVPEQQEQESTGVPRNPPESTGVKIGQAVVSVGRAMAVKPGLVPAVLPPGPVLRGPAPAAASLADAAASAPASSADADQLKTTLMLRNLGAEVTTEVLVEELRRFGMDGRVDFAHAWRDFKTKSCKGYAYVNFFDPADARNLREMWHGRRELGGIPCHRRSTLSVAYAHKQGFDICVLESRRRSMKDPINAMGWVHPRKAGNVMFREMAPPGLSSSPPLSPPGFWLIIGHWARDSQSSTG